MKKLITYFITAILALSILSCEEQYVEPFEHFVIPAGKHKKGMKLESLQSSALNFTAIFDHSAIYQTKTIVNQHDINKLMGFADCNSQHHDNSARFGWRWLDNKLEIHAYAYVRGERITKLIGGIDLEMEYDYQIKITKNAYIFYLQGFETVEIERRSKCEKGLYYMLFPFFGGNEVAPHDILIRIKRNY